MLSHFFYESISNELLYIDHENKNLLLFKTRPTRETLAEKVLMLFQCLWINFTSRNYDNLIEISCFLMCELTNSTRKAITTVTLSA